MINEYSDLEKLTQSLTEPQVKQPDLPNQQSAQAEQVAAGNPAAPVKETYEGERNDKGQYHGMGTLINKTGKYQGLFKNGKCDGQGTYAYTDGRTSTGVFDKGLREGAFTTEWPDGRRLEGIYKGNAIKSGEMTFPSGSWFNGTFTDGKFHEGTFFNGNKKTTYKGHFKDSKYGGQGGITGPEHSYKGAFAAGLYEGKGVYEKFIEPKMSYKGDFKMGKFHGFGERTMHREQAGYNVCKGEFFQGLAHGKCTFYHSDGKRKLTGVVKYGKLDGQFVQSEPGKSNLKLTYKDNKVVRK